MNPRAALATFAEWIHHAAAVSLTAAVGGPALTTAYLAVYVVPAYLIRGPRWLRWLSPAAWVAAALLPAGPATLLAIGTAAGIGRAAAGRPSAWLFGLERSGGLAAVLGAAAGTALLTSSTEVTFLVAAVAVAISVPGELVRAGSSGGLAPAALAACAVIGMRVLEPVLLIDPISGAVFSLAWASGAGLGARWARRDDLRPAAAAPFLGAAAIALIGGVEGPGMLLLWAATGASVVMVVTAARATGQRRAMTALGLVVAGGATAAVGVFEMVGSALWFAAVCLLVGGFTSLAMLTREAKRASTAAAPMDLPAVPDDQPEITLDLAAAVAEAPARPAGDVQAVAMELLGALKLARSIRAEAMEQVRLSVDPFCDLRGRADLAFATLSATVDAVKATSGLPSAGPDLVDLDHPAPI